MEINDAQDTISWEELKSFISGFSKRVLQKMRKYWYLVLLILFLPLIGFLTKTYFKEKEYQLQSTLGFQYSHQKIYGQLVSELNYLLQTGDHEELNKRLETAEVDWKNINTIEATNIFGFRLDEDMGTSQYPFYLIVRGKNSEAILPCMKALVHYLDTHFSISKNQELELNVLGEKKIFYEKQIRIIDSLIAERKPGQIQFSLSQGSGPVFVSENSQLLDLQEKYMLKISEIELEILKKSSNIKVFSYGVVKEI